MQSTFVIARRSKCRQNSPQEPRHLPGTDRNRLPDEHQLKLEPRQTVPPNTPAPDNDDDEILLI